MDNQDYFERIEITFEELEDLLDNQPEDLDVSTAAGVINVTFPNGVVFVFSRQPPTQQLWLATPGGGFHYEWSEADRDWKDTKTGDVFRPFLVTQIREHGQLDIDWD